MVALELETDTSKRIFMKCEEAMGDEFIFVKKMAESKFLVNIIRIP
jgi:hypothetical protein